MGLCFSRGDQKVRTEITHFFPSLSSLFFFLSCGKNIYKKSTVLKEIQVHNIVSLTIGTVLYSRSLEFIHLV